MKRSLPPQRGFFPQPVYLIGAFKPDGRPNFALITFITFCSIEPLLLIFATRGGKMTPGLIDETGVFSANLATADMVGMADYCGNVSGFSADKCEDTGAAWMRGAVLDVPILDRSPWAYECELVETMARGDGRIYCGAVRSIMVDEAVKDASYGSIDLTELDPLIYSPGGYYRIGGRIGSVGEAKKAFTKR